MLGRPGPVVLALPEDMLYSVVKPNSVPDYPAYPKPSEDAIEAVKDRWPKLSVRLWWLAAHYGMKTMWRHYHALQRLMTCRSLVLSVVNG